MVYNEKKESQEHRISEKLDRFKDTEVIAVFFLTALLVFVAIIGIVQVMSQPAPDTDFVLAIDNSFSMDIPDYEETRMKMVKSKIDERLESLPEGSKVGIVSFSDEARVEINLTENKYRVENALNSLRPDLTSFETAAGDAIIQGLDMLSKSKRNKEILVIIDGNNSEGKSLSESFELSSESDVKVSIIAIESFNRTERLHREVFRATNQTGTLSSTMPALQEDELQEAVSIYDKGAALYTVDSPERLERALDNTLLGEEGLDPAYYIFVLLTAVLIPGMFIYFKSRDGLG